MEKISKYFTWIDPADILISYVKGSLENTLRYKVLVVQFVKHNISLLVKVKVSADWHIPMVTYVQWCKMGVRCCLDNCQIINVLLLLFGLL